MTNADEVMRAANQGGLVGGPSRWRKKPVVIEAMLYDGTNAAAIEEWSGGNVEKQSASDLLDCDTLEGVMRASVGDWVIRGVKGEFYPCKPDIFEQTYEEA